MKKGFIFFALLLVGACSTNHSEHNQSHYAGEEKREIKAISAEEISNYLNGNGMGLAKAAELNGYPGPKHILENESTLELTAVQKEEIQSSFQKMKNQAVDLGKQIVEKEKELDSLFGQSKIDGDLLKTKTQEVAKLQGDLRNVHLQAHLEMKKVLSPEQVSKYNQLRGYNN